MKKIFFSLCVLFLLVHASCRKHTFVAYNFSGKIYNDSTKLPFTQPIKFSVIEDVRGGNKISILNAFRDEVVGPLSVDISDGSFSTHIKTMGKHSTYELIFYYSNDIGSFTSIKNLSLTELKKFNNNIVFVKPN